MAFVARIETTYADLREGETIVDKNGNRWRAVEVGEFPDQVGDVNFWLADSTTGVKMHQMAKPHADPVTVLRVPTRDEEIAAREAEVDAAEADTSYPINEPGEVLTEAEAVEVAEEVLGAETIAEETVEAEEQRAEADETGQPFPLPPFEDMTDLEMRSHIFLVHGVYCHDIKSRAKLTVMHDDLHADAGHRSTPHTHGAAR